MVQLGIAVKLTFPSRAENPAVSAVQTRSKCCAVLIGQVIRGIPERAQRTKEFSRKRPAVGVSERVHRGLAVGQE